MYDISDFERIIEYTFRDKNLLRRALTHSSYAVEQGQEGRDYERLEFLGDAVLELSMSDHLYKNHPEMDEGVMTKTRARLVCESALYVSARRLDVGSFVLLSRGEEKSGGRNKAAILSDVLEAVIGAIYLDSGFEEARRFIIRFTEVFIRENGLDVNTVDNKTQLQEYVQKRFRGRTLRYKVVGEDGPDHMKTFAMQVLLDDRIIGEGTGASKQSAGQNAARMAMDRLEKEYTGSRG